MTEVPEHLLRRSRERKAALEGGDAGGEAPAPTNEASGSVEPASAAASTAPAAASTGTPARVAPAAYTGPPQLPPRKQRVPMWVMPVVVVLPLWAFFYAGAFGERAVHGPESPIDVGRVVYQEHCTSCHGAAGGGGVGPALDAVLTTFPEFDAHVAWVTEGSAQVAGQEYAAGKVATGGMPGFASSLTAEQIVAVSCYERVDFGGEELPEQCAAPAEGEGEGGAGEGAATEGEASG